MTEERNRVDKKVDVLVIGSGAGGLSAAVTAAHAGLKVLVCDRAAVLGGSTAWSGGWMWIPANGLVASPDPNEAPDAARTYLKAVLGDAFEPHLIDAFLGGGPEMVDFFHHQTSLQFDASKTICDIYGHKEGAGTGGRSVIAAPYEARNLGKLLPLLREVLPQTALFGMPIMAGADLTAFLTATRRPSSFLHVVRRLTRHMWDCIFHRRAMHLVNGNALVARLLKSGEDLGVQWLTEAPVVRLTTEQGRVTGAALVWDGEEIFVTARRGVVLATGGFPQNLNLSTRSPRSSINVTTSLSVAVPEADGAGLKLALSVGGELKDWPDATEAGCPVSLVPLKDGKFAPYPHIIERAKPGIIGVLQNGARFVNEADGYHDYVKALLAATPKGEAPVSWLICDQKFIARYGLGIVRPFPFPKTKWIKNGYLKVGSSLAALAEVCGIDAAGLTAAIDHYNRGAALGDDPAFGRGSTPFNRAGGDASVTPNPNLAPITCAPFYAVKVHAGSFGTFSGIKADANGRVVAGDGEPIEGLFVAGSDMASVMGGHYPAGGINLGPAMTFGYIVGRTLAAMPIA